MTRLTPLDPYTLPLDRTTLIEASAGTGKTYTITTLVARLAADGFPVESILVVTFTEAAAAELKLRIRKRLSNALAGLARALAAAGETDREGGPAGPAAPEDDLVRFFLRQPDPHLISRRIAYALTCFDQACIMTIHSFCLATLKEQAFETGTPFDMALVADRSAFFRQTCMDFFMTRINDLDPLMLQFLRLKGITPETVEKEMAAVVSRPDLSTVPASARFEDIFEDYREIVSEIRTLLETEDRAVADLIQAHKGLDKRSYSKKNVPAWLAAAKEKARAGENTVLFIMAETGDSLYKFTRTRLAAKTKPGAAMPSHRLFDLCETLLGLYQSLEINLISLKLDFLSFFNRELKRLKQEKGQCFFDDLVNDLAAALTGPAGNDLQKAVRDRYRACLIDEFQDTDPAQYTIFSRLFGRGRPFFMIGDPKQAIYAFRGGDIFAYLSACRDSRQMFTLDKNYRSAPALVQAVNDLFCFAANPFLFESIGFTRVGTPASARDRLRDGDGPVPPFQFSILSREGMVLDRQGFIKRDTANALIPDLVARQMAADLAAGLTLVDEDGTPVPLGPGHMAVLVRTNRQAEEIQKALSLTGIPSFLSKTGSVFDSREAVELNDILWAVFRPDHKGFLKAALTSSVFGFSLSRLARLDDRALGLWQDRFRQMKDQWETRGFVSMIMDLFHSEEGLLHPDSPLSERGLTNFYHLIELISQAALNRHLSMFFLLKWYQAQLSAETREQSADELRLESDRKAAAIVTIHKSKGLEYPVVYLPYLWAGAAARSTGPVLFHDPGAGNGLTLDLRSPGAPDTVGLDRSLARQNLETAAEERRLLYVALTRASVLCRVFWGGFSGVESSALAGLLHPLGCQTDGVIRDDLARLSGESGSRFPVPQIKVREIEVREIRDAGPVPPYQPEDPGSQELTAKRADRFVDPGFRISSFTAMAASHSPVSPVLGGPQVPGADTAPLSDPGDDAPIILRTFPKGAGAGDFFHAVFETLNFKADDAAIHACVQQQLDGFGLTGSLLDQAAAAVRDVLSARLTIPGQPETRFSLEDIDPSHCLKEMEFLFASDRFTMARLAEGFEDAGTHPDYAGQLRQLAPDVPKGFIKGFIDLVFRFRGKYYLLDYKSNYLGETYGCYHGSAMAAAMADHHYILQYHLYTLALHRYLSNRMPGYDYGRDFGGVFYLFIRGMHPDKQNTGIVYDCPPRRLLESMDRIMDPNAKSLY